METLLQELGTLTQGGLMWLFATVVILDIVTGFAKAFISKTFTSREATDGLIRQVVRCLVFFSMTFVIHILSPEPTPSLDALVTLLQLAFIVAYIRSLFENFREMDLKFFGDLNITKDDK